MGLNETLDRLAREREEREQDKRDKEIVTFSLSRGALKCLRDFYEGKLDGIRQSLGDSKTSDRKRRKREAEAVKVIEIIESINKVI